MTTHTPFPQQPVRTVLAIAKGLVAPNYVVRDRQGRWLALPDPPQKPPKDLQTVAWMDVLVVDPDLAQLVQLAPGEMAVRDDMHTPWTVRSLPSPREQQQVERASVDHQLVVERERRWTSHRDALVAYGLLLGIAQVVTAAIVFMLTSGVPAPVEGGWSLWGEVQNAWWPMVASGAAWVVSAIAVAVTRRGLLILPGVLVAAGCYLWPLYRDARLLPLHLLLGGLAAVLAWRGIVLEIARRRALRARRRYDEQHPPRSLPPAATGAGSSGARAVTTPRERTVTTAG